PIRECYQALACTSSAARVPQDRGWCQLLGRDGAARSGLRSSSMQHMKPGLGRKNFTCPPVTIDFRVSGTFRAMIVYRGIVQDKRHVFTFAWDYEGAVGRDRNAGYDHFQSA